MIKLCVFRARVKIACDLLRQVVPGMTPGTDKATVFEYAYEYIKYLQKTAPDCHEKVRIFVED